MKSKLVFLLLAFQISCRTAETDSSALDTAIAETNIDIIESIIFNDVELSSVTTRQLPNNSGLEVLAISDSSYKVQGVTYDKGLSKKLYHYDVGTLAGKSSGKSQWEAIAADKSRVFMLAEGSSNVFIFNQDLLKLDSSIALNVPKTHALYPDWNADTNSRGEGMILLDSGHILLLKEKNPVQLIEFGPKTATAKGFKPGDGVDSNESFPLNINVTEFVPLKYWNIGSNSQPYLSDASDLAIGPGGRLFAISDKTNRIVAIENVLKPTEDKFKVKEVWVLPGKIDKAEGLAFTPAFEPIVVSDLTGKDKNLFILTALD